MTTEKGSRNRLVGMGMSLSVVVWLAAPATAFHDGGVAACSSCHIMHDSEDGRVLMDVSGPLLAAATATDLCLVCHGGPTGVFGNQPLAPPPEKGGGNFVFLLEDNLNDALDGGTAPIHGEAAGHSLVSLDMGLGADSRWSYAPGGTFPSGQLGCTSCHDPHGNTNFRMLYGTGEVQGGLFTFVYPAPVASGLPVVDRLAVESRSLHSAYVSGMSAWCANCHGRYHDESGTSRFAHSFDRTVSGRKAANYNIYNGVDDPVGGSIATAYLPEVPFEDADAAPQSTAGPHPWSKIMCLTCHRAHASSAPAAGRWDFNVQYLSRDGLASGSYPLPSPYPSPVQDTLCKKCHTEAEVADYMLHRQ